MDNRKLDHCPRESFSFTIPMSHESAYFMIERDQTPSSSRCLPSYLQFVGCDPPEARLLLTIALGLRRSSLPSGRRRESDLDNSCRRESRLTSARMIYNLIFEK